MSTKIYTGYQLDAPDGVAALFAWQAALVVALREAYQAEYLRTTASIAVGLHDVARAGKSPTLKAGSPLLTATSTLDAAHRSIRETQRRNPQLDFECQYVLLADPQDPEHLYAILYTERDAYTEIFAHAPGVRYFGYWNNTDRPADVSDDDWTARGATWDRVVGYASPASRGLSFELLGSYHTATPPLFGDEAVKLLAYLPSDEQRLQNVRRALGDNTISADVIVPITTEALLKLDLEDTTEDPADVSDATDA